MDKLISRLPERRSIIGVYATAVFMIYGWTLLASFWKFPSWMFYLKIQDIVSVYAYSFMIDFIESVLLIFAAVFVGLVLPKRWWNEKFTIRGALWIIVAMGSLMMRLYTNRAPDDWEEFVYNQWNWWGVTFLLGVVLDFVFTRVSWLRSGLETLTDRMVVFLYIYLPLTAISFLIIFARIVF
jgi:hypothetical protein